MTNIGKALTFYSKYAPEIDTLLFSEPDDIDYHKRFFPKLQCEDFNTLVSQVSRVYDEAESEAELIVKNFNIKFPTSLKLGNVLLEPTLSKIRGDKCWRSRFKIEKKGSEKDTRALVQAGLLIYSDKQVYAASWIWVRGVSAENIGKAIGSQFKDNIEAWGSVKNEILLAHVAIEEGMFVEDLLKTLIDPFAKVEPEQWNELFVQI